MQAHLPDLRQETGPTHDVAYQKENSLQETCRMKCQAVCFKQRGCYMQIFNSPALLVDHEKVKKNSNAKIEKKRKEKETLKFFYSSERNSSGLCMVVDTQWHQTNERQLTVLLSLSA